MTNTIKKTNPNIPIEALLMNKHPHMQSNHWNTWYNARADYQTNALAYYDYLAEMNLIPLLFETLINHLLNRDIDFQDTDSIKFEKEGDWTNQLDDIIKVSSTLKLSKHIEKYVHNNYQFDLNNALEIFSDGAYTPNYVKLFEYLADKIENIEVDRSYKDKRFKKIVHNLPLKFPDWQKVSDDHDGARFYPQSFAIDKQNNHIFVNYSPTSTLTNDRVIAVYDLITAKYVSCFYAGNAGGEATVIRHVDSKTFLYVKTTNHKIGKIDVSIIPDNLSRPSYLEEISTNVEWEFDFSEGRWYQLNYSSDFGAVNRKTNIDIYNENFSQRKGCINLNTEDVGMNSSKYERLIAKRQGIAVYGDKLYSPFGGYTVKGATEDNYSSQGYRVFNSRGNLTEELILQADKMINILEANGVECEQIENEGISIDDEGTLYTLSIVNKLDNPKANLQGILIFEEMATNTEGSIDFKSAYVFNNSMNTPDLNSAMYPRNFDGKYYNVLTSEKITSISDFIDFMFNASISKVMFYSSIDDITSSYWGSKIPSNRLVEITNVNNITAFITYHGNPNTSSPTIETSYYKSNNVYVERAISDFTTSSVIFETGFEDWFNAEKVRLVKNSKIIKFEGGVKGDFKAGSAPIKIFTITNDNFKPLVDRNIIFMIDNNKEGYGCLHVTPSGEVFVSFLSHDTKRIIINSIYY